MPKYIAPHKSGAHRIAGIGLFRTLLRRCRAAQIDDHAKSSSQNVIRNSFKRNRHATSAVALQKAFYAGYEAINLLTKSVTGDAASTTRITTLLTSTPRFLTKPPPRAPLAPRKLPKGKPLNPDSSAVLSRPRVTVPGKRHVPVLVAAANYPMLRFKKPQPLHLGAYLNKRSMKRQLRHDQRDSMVAEEQLGIQEDEWDSIVQAVALEEGVEMERQGGRGEQSWAWGFKYCTWYLGSKLKMEWEKSVQLTAQMEEVIERERALAEHEETFPASSGEQ